MMSRLSQQVGRGGAMKNFRLNFRLELSSVASFFFFLEEYVLSFFY